MHSIQASKLSKFVVCATLCFLCGSLRTMAASTVNFKLLRGYLIVIPVMVNGAGPYEFLVDTGTNTTLLGSEFARQLRLRPLDRIELVTVAGSQLLVRSQVASLTVGAQTVTPLEVLWSELRELRAIEPKICGVLGQNFLAQFNYLIDYRKQRLEFEDVDELETRLCGEPLTLEWHEGQALLSVPGKKKHWRFVPDTGVAGLLLFTPSGSGFEFDWEPGAPETGQARTDLGSRLVQQRRLRSFPLSRTTLYDLPVMLMKTAPGGAERSEDGLLPTSLFERIYFNHRKSYLILNPKNVG